MSLFKGRKASKKKRKLEAAEEEWDEIEEEDDGSDEVENERGEEESAASTARLKKRVEPEDTNDEDEYEDDEDDEERPRRKKKKRGFPVGGLIFMFILIGIILGAGYFGMEYYERLHAMNEEFNTVRDAAAAELAAAQTEYALADPDSPSNAAVREELKEVLLADIREQVEQMESEEAELDSSIREAEEKMKKLEGIEDFDYYKAIYDEYVEGREYVEELLSGN